MGEIASLYQAGDSVPYIGPDNLTPGKWNIRLEYDETPFMAQMWASLLSNSKQFGVAGNQPENYVSIQFSNNMADALENWRRESVDLFKSALFLGWRPEWRDVTTESESGTSVTIRYPKAVNIEIEIIENPFLTTAVIVVGLFAALTAIHAIFPKASRAVFSNIGGVFGDIGKGISEPVKAIGIPIAIAAAVIGLVIWYSA